MGRRVADAPQLGMTLDTAARIFIADSIGDRLWRVDGAPVTTTTATSSTTTTTLRGCG